MDTKEFIKRAKEIYGDKYDYSKVDYKNARTKVCIICHKKDVNGVEHGEFWITPDNHLRKHACKKCANEEQSLKNRLSKAEFLGRVKQVQPNLFIPENTEYNGIKKPITLYCNKHEEYYTIIAETLLYGCHCPKCSGRLDTKEFIKRAHEVHGEKYDYSKVEYKSPKIDVCIICPKHGEFWQKPSNHLRGNGCSECKKDSIKKKNSMPMDEFIKRAREIHGDKYDYSKVDLLNRDEKGRVCIICPKHGEFWQVPSEHLNGHNCPKCSNKNLTQDEYIEQLNKRHNYFYDYSKSIIKRAHDKIDVICPKHGTFRVSVSNHLQGQGCPKCVSSLLELDLINLFEENNIDYIYQANKTTFKWLGLQSLDFYLPDYNIAIECQGRQHYEIVERFGGEKEFDSIQKRDEKKHNLCVNNNVVLLYYTKPEYKKFDKDAYIDKNLLLNYILNYR